MGMLASCGVYVVYVVRTALRLIGLVTAVVAAVAEPIAGNTLVNGLAFELIVGTGIHYIQLYKCHK